MITLENVTKYYELKGGEKHYVVKNISLVIPPNRSLAILGPNGAGKSTLLRLIGGAEAPNSGRIISEANISWPLGLNVGFQGSLTGRQNLQFVCEINGLSKRQTAQILKEVQEFAEIDKFFDMPVKSYSSGMRARLGFGLSICFDFDYYLIDELTAVGDAIFRQKAQAEFAKIKDRASLVFVAHNLQTLRQSCDSALFLRNGEASYYEDIEDGIKAYEVYIDKHAPKKKHAGKKAAKKHPAKKTIAKVANKVPLKQAVKKIAAKNTPLKQAAKKIVTSNNLTKKAAKKNPAKKVATIQTKRAKDLDNQQNIQPENKPPQS